eukprot:TRINITY_DN4282_c0_g1_i1.p1 TRINITY_DN4282_c0_g1~~TRINITY_DN4282_c0_g1_i1.p1  ORF type:complete len:474 (-),score=175.74 TRINITY_DN4282_c0_g1_i1:711-1958(-)
MVGLPMRALAYSTAIALLLLGEAEGGLLRVGKPIPWTNALPHLNYVREHGVSQFINRYREVRDICNDELKWGDEVEYGIFKVDHGAKKVRVALRAAEVREALEAREAAHSYRAEGCAWHPEYGAWMLEGTPPRTSPNDPHIGWRTEFRSLEVQLTDFENAAFVVFIVLVTRVILAFDLNLYMPLSKVDANMRRAHARDGVLREKFWFRRCIDPPVAGGESPQEEGPDCCAEMTILEILMGQNGGGGYPGLIPLVYAYLDYIGTDAATFERVEAYLELLRRRASGEVMTAAAWMRRFVTRHPAYCGDSVVSDEVAYDLMLAARDVGEGRRAAPELLGPEVIEPVLPEGAFDVPLASARIDAAARRELIDRYAWRRSPSSSAAARRQETSSSNFSSTFERYDSDDAAAECEPFTWGA